MRSIVKTPSRRVGTKMMARLFRHSCLATAVVCSSWILVSSYAALAQSPDLSNATHIKIGNDQTIVYPLADEIKKSATYDHRLKMSDGVEISINIYQPQTQDKVPIVIAFTSYGKDMWPDLWVTYTRGTPFRALGDDVGSLIASDEMNWEAPDPGFWVPNGYALIVVDARGTGKSGGKKNPFSKRTHEDFAAVVEWASEQPWTTGKIGSLGTSYLGISQWYVSALRPKGLAAMAVWEGLTDLVRDAAFHGGIPETAFVPWWMSPGRVKGIDPAAPTQFGMTDLPKLPSMSFYTDYQIPPTDVENINVPALVVSTWSNQGLHSRGGFVGYNRLKTEKYLYTHGRHEWTTSNSTEAHEYEKAFFDYYLKGDQTAKAKLMNVRLEVHKGDGEYYVREERAWPLEDTKYQKLYIDAYNGSLKNEPLSHETRTQYNSVDTNDFNTSNEVAFRHTFQKDTEIVGYSKLKLWVSTTHGNDMDMFVAIKKLDSSGNVKKFMNALMMRKVASRGWLRVSLRKLDPELATDIDPVLAFDEYQPIKPNEIVPVEIEILPFAVFFEKGSILELVVKGSDIAQEPTVQHDKLVNQGYHNIFAGKNHDSYLMLPVIDRPILRATHTESQ